MKKPPITFVVAGIVVLAFIFGQLHQRNMTQIEQDIELFYADHPDWLDNQSAVTYTPFPWGIITIMLALSASAFVQLEIDSISKEGEKTD